MVRLASHEDDSGDKRNVIQRIGSNDDRKSVETAPVMQTAMQSW